MNESLEKKMLEVQELLKGWPADASTYVLLFALRQILAPIHSQVMTTGLTEQDKLVAKQIKLITDIASAIMEMLDVKNANLKS